MADIRSRCYHLILYEEDLEQLRVLDMIEQHYNFGAIRHDKDMYDGTTELKKPHYHVILYFDNPKYLSSLSDELKLKPNYIKTDQLRKGLEYLIHKNNPEKFQYSVDEVYGPLKDNLLAYLSNSVSNEKTSTLFLFQIIDSFDGPIKLEELIPIVLQNNLWSFFRRSQLTWFKLIDEHNRKYHLQK